MKQIGDTYALDRCDLIRINRLVRGKIDISGYRDWYGSISRAEQITLTFGLYTLTVHTGFHVQLSDKAVETSGVPLKLAEVLKLLVCDGSLGKLRAWLEAASNEDTDAAFPLFVHLFGESEAAVMAIETKETCNHWWHRDLLDPRVIADLMSNPNWHGTSPKDDIK